MSRSIWLMYHEVHTGSPRPGVPGTSARYQISTQQFEEQLGAIQESGRKVVTARDYARAPDGDSIVITFDDGWRGTFELALPLLQKHGLAATFYVTQDLVGKPNFCTPEMLKIAAEAGMEIGTHGASHERAARASSRNVVLQDFRDCKAFLESVAGTQVVSGSQPGGYHSPLIAACAAEAGLTSLSISQPGVNRSRTSPFKLKRIAIMSWTSAAEVARYCRYDVRREVLVWSLRQVPRILLGGERYKEVRKRLLNRGQGPVY